MSMGAKNMKIAPGALGTNKIESGSAKLAPTPTVPPKIDFESAKHQNGTRRHRYREKRVLKEQTKKQERCPRYHRKWSRSAKHENWTQRPHHKT
jgi:hypothetical protein